MNRERKARLDAKLGEVARTCYVPRVEAGEAKTGCASKFAGTAWLPKGKTWPKCAGCKRVQHLLVQLRTEDVPGAVVALGKKQVLQIFHCGVERCAARIQVIAEAGGKAAPKPPTKSVAQRIVGFDEHRELPGREDASDAGVKLHAKDLRAMEQSGPRDRLKLGGWPMWIQSAERPRCSTCDGPMEFVLQLQSEQYIAVAWGDSGLAYVHQCPKHPKQFAFSWSST